MSDYKKRVVDRLLERKEIALDQALIQSDV